MKPLEPSIRVNVDAINPGQFFACCGLLELADRLWPGAEGWFENSQFCVQGAGTLADLLNMLVSCEPVEVLTLENGLPVKPLIAPLKFILQHDRRIDVVLDAWMTIRVENGAAAVVANPPWNFWSGQQTSHRIWRDLRRALAEQLDTLPVAQLDDLFNQRLLLSGRFGFDPGAAWNALDVGFSPNEQGIEVASSAAVEMLAAVGLQRFRPLLTPRRDQFIYATWRQPLVSEIAAAAASASIDSVPHCKFLGRVISRGSYAALGRSTQLPGDDNGFR